MPVRIYLKYLLIGLITFFITIAKPYLVTAFGTYEQAQYLTNKGNEQLNLGQGNEALDNFREATQIYKHLKYEEGITGSLINQSLALQSLGLYPRACKGLLESLKLEKEDWICNPQQQTDNQLNFDKLKLTPVNLLALQSLGENLGGLGKLAQSRLVLQKTLVFAKQLPNFDINPILLSLANTERTIYQQARGKYFDTEELSFKEKISDFIVKQALNTLQLYQSIKEPSVSQKLQSQLNTLSLSINFSKWLQIAIESGRAILIPVQSQIQQQTESLIEIILQESEIFSELPINQSIYFQINLANNLAQFPGEQFKNFAIRFAESAFDSARSIRYLRMQSYSLGILGKLKPEEAELSWIKALGIAQSINDLELSYRWQKELATLYKGQRENRKAIQFYGDAIKSITKIKANLITSNTDLQFSFQETVEPLYRDYLRILLKDANPNLGLIKQINNNFQIAQLENFLKCGKLDLISLDKSTIPADTAIINILDLNDIVLIMTEVNNSLNYYVTPSLPVRNSIDNLLSFLQNDEPAAIKKELIIAESQGLFNLLIAPIENYLPSKGTLVFTLDTSFQSIPMGILHNGKDYLIQHYRIAETIGSKIRPLKSLSNQGMKALIAGLSENSPSFKAENSPENLQPLPEVVEEVAGINNEIASISLLNEKFTSLRFQQELNRNFPIVHVSTHGQFSSDPERTVLLAWDKPINVQEFNGWLKTQEKNQDPIELLVLSACQTAKGNKRSALGIAGVAAQAGARSIIASTWLVDSESTSELMIKLYKGLRQGLSKAEALRQAQLSLLQSESEFSHPYYWAGFLLVGSWL